jgi:hypothetical protein
VHESSSLILASDLRTLSSAFPTFLSCLSTCLDISFFKPLTSNLGTAAASARRRDMSREVDMRGTCRKWSVIESGIAKHLTKNRRGEDAFDVRHLASKTAGKGKLPPSRWRPPAARDGEQTTAWRDASPACACSWPVHMFSADIGESLCLSSAIPPPEKAPWRPKRGALCGSLVKALLLGSSAVFHSGARRDAIKAAAPHGAEDPEWLRPAHVTSADTQRKAPGLINLAFWCILE